LKKVRNTYLKDKAAGKLTRDGGDIQQHHSAAVASV
jgi:hypothetical protein